MTVDAARLQAFADASPVRPVLIARGAVERRGTRRRRCPRWPGTRSNCWGRPTWRACGVRAGGVHAVVRGRLAGRAAAVVRHGRVRKPGEGGRVPAQAAPGAVLRTGGAGAGLTGSPTGIVPTAVPGPPRRSAVAFARPGRQPRAPPPGRSTPGGRNSARSTTEPVHRAASPPRRRRPCTGDGPPTGGRAMPLSDPAGSDRGIAGSRPPVGRGGASAAEPVRRGRTPAPRSRGCRPAPGGAARRRRPGPWSGRWRRGRGTPRCCGRCC